jgi:formylglycine-generating enzyme required for sulfatase activity
MFAVATGTELPADEGWGRGRRPVINVSWEDAVTYAEWLSHHTGKRYRLPSEAEWEYAARSGGKEEKWAGTSTEGELGNYAWHFYNSGRQSHPVGMKKTNGLGLYDMSGNVYEWIEDWWNGGYKGAPDDGSVWKSGDSEFRVMRGGCWYNLPRGVRSVYRYGNALHLRHKSIGFRLAQDL